jgi:anti-sigma factor RsiW
MTRARCLELDEALLSGHLDGALTQQDTQRVRLHLEDCPECRRLYEELAALREVTMSSRFSTPSDDQWDERPRGPLSRLTFGIGWTVLLAWLVGLAGFAIGQLWTGPESLAEKLLVFGGLAGVGLLLLSVLIDRLAALGSDRYREVEK